MNRPTVRQLEYLAALKEHKSFSKAASACSVTQAALSLGIQDLENLIGHSLIDRSRRKVMLTALGEEIANDAKGLLQYMDYMHEHVRALTEPMTGPLRLGVIPTIAPYLLPQIITEISDRYPGIQLQIDEDLTHRLVDKINNSKLDLILLALPYETPHLEQMFLFEDDFLLATPGFYPKPEKEIKISDLHPEDLLLLKDGHCLRDHALNACKLQPPAHEKTYSATSMPTLLEMVAAGLGATLLPKMAVKTERYPKNIHITPIGHPRPYREIGLAWHQKSLLQEDYKTLGRMIKFIWRDQFLSS